nr:MAG TPA: hypothetical protein [Bacteriophage sp.]
MYFTEKSNAFSSGGSTTHRPSLSASASSRRRS